MKRVKRLIKFTLTVILLVGSLGGCGTNVNKNNNTNNKQIEVPNGDVEEDVEEKPEEKPEEPAEEEKTQIKSSVLYEDSNYKITFTNFMKDWAGLEMNLELENNSDKDIIIQIENISVNGFMENSMFSADVMSGMKARDSITLTDLEIEPNEVKDVTVQFIIMDTDYNTLLETEKITLNL